MAQVTEDILLSRIDQSGFRPKCVNMIDKPLLPIEVGVMSQVIVINTFKFEVLSCEFVLATVNERSRDFIVLN